LGVDCRLVPYLDKELHDEKWLATEGSFFDAVERSTDIGII
jgi:hypothetical protein